MVGFSKEEKEPLLPGSPSCEQGTYIGDGTVWPLFSKLFLESVNPDGLVMGQLYCRHVTDCQVNVCCCLWVFPFYVSCLVFWLFLFVNISFIL